MNPWSKRTVSILVLVGALAAFFWALPTPQPVVANPAAFWTLRNVRVFDGETVIESAAAAEVAASTVSDFESGGIDDAELR